MVADEVAAKHPDVTLEHRLVDSFAMSLVTQPAAFDVVVTENLFGDILSDEASVLTGSLGMLPSASLGERDTEHGRFGLYEPVHGSAPDIVGRDAANPLGDILSGALLLRWSLRSADAADAIESAASRVLARRPPNARPRWPRSRSRPTRAPWHRPDVGDAMIEQLASGVTSPRTMELVR